MSDDEAKFATILGYELGVAEGWREAIEALRDELQKCATGVRLQAERYEPDTPWRIRLIAEARAFEHAATLAATLTPEDKS